MKKTVFVTNFIICLLGLNFAKAQATDFIIQASAYSITSEAGRLPTLPTSTERSNWMNPR
ncbi:MAG: hypothetical protein K2L03_07380 [Bacteroidales bacterium]|nr:hypothetical protein [Bacteroidales bacterium]